MINYNYKVNISVYSDLTYCARVNGEEIFTDSDFDSLLDRLSKYFFGFIWIWSMRHVNKPYWR